LYRLWEKRGISRKSRFFIPPSR